MTTGSGIIALPFPPSVNRIWRTRTKANGKPGFYLDKRYATWKRVADNEYLANKRHWKPVKGPFHITVTLNNQKRRGDADNRLKAVLDWLERVELIENDSLAESVLIRWGYAPEGCRVELSPAKVPV